MALTPSNMLPLGTNAPDFKLYDTVSKQWHELQDLRGEKGSLVMFICNHCPFVVHVSREIAQLAKDYKGKGVNCIAISSNDVGNYPEDSPKRMNALAKEQGYIFPYLYDELQEVAKAYDAACTPDFYLFNEDLVLVYRGQLDDSRPGNGIPVTGKDLREALDCLLSGKAIAPEQKPSVGCNIKWKS